jgi:hypothetical protein
MEKLIVLTKQASNYTITRFLDHIAPELRGHVIPVAYERLVANERIPAANYVFTDIDRATRPEIEKAVRVAHVVTESGRGLRVFNWPNRSRMRYELLRLLFERGINRFNVYRYTELRTPARFPVFIRRLSEHNGSGTKLLHSAEAVERAIEFLLRIGCDRDDLLVTEFADTRSPDGVYRKYATYLIDGEVFPGHLAVSKSWSVKYSDVVTPETIDAEIEFFRANPFADELREIFALAGVDYGRIDFALLDGRPQVWEINTNPNLYGTTVDRYPDRLDRAFRPYVFPKLVDGFSRMLRPAVAAKAASSERV